MNTPAALLAAAKGDLENFEVASTPGGIEAQELAGQATANAMATLPIDMGKGTRADLESLGFVFGEALDDLFVHCKFPPGWRKQSTEHSMHSDLLDDKGRCRGRIFYKAAFYDRRADLRLVKRYTFDYYLPCDADGKPMEHRNHSHYKTCITDCEREIHLIGVRSKALNESADPHFQLAKNWLDEHFPDWQNPLAYWD